LSIFSRQRRCISSIFISSGTVHLNCVFSLGTGYFGLYFISRSGLLKSIFISLGTVHLNCVFLLGTGYFGLCFTSRSGLFKSIFILSGTVHLNCVFSLGTGYLGLYFTSRSALFKSIFISSGTVHLYYTGYSCLNRILEYIYCRGRVWTIFIVRDGEYKLLILFRKICFWVHLCYNSYWMINSNVCAIVANST
jgi:hypothetical protein